jgi:hypothetical protein
MPADLTTDTGTNLGEASVVLCGQDFMIEKNLL